MKKSILAIVCIALLSLCFTSNASAQCLQLNGQSGQGLVMDSPTLNNGIITFKLANDVNDPIRVDWRQAYYGPILFYKLYYKDSFTTLSFPVETNEFTITFTRTSYGYTEYETRYYLIKPTCY